MKPYYEDGSVTIYHGDWRDWSGSADVILTDPPYGIDHPTDYADRERGHHAPCKDYPPVYGDREPFDPAPLLALGIPSILWGANYYASRLPESSGWLIWDKDRPHDLDQATAEMAWSNFVKGARVFRWLWHGMIRRGDDVLTHPTQKPEALMRWCLSLKWTPPGTVLDPFMGSGTTLRAAKDLGRKAIGIEIEECYCEIAATRMSQLVLEFQPKEGK